jgi:Ca-activated chloride channel family protein
LEVHTVVVELATCAIVVVAIAAELLHAQRSRRLAPLAFGPNRQPATWARAAPLLRVAAIGALGWGFGTLLLLDPKVHTAKEVPDAELKHVMLVLDVSPSMRLQDAGVEKDQSRRQRALALMESFFKRIAIQQYRISIVAVYNGAKPVVVDTRDVEVVRNILDDLPMEYAFPSGKTDIFAGLEEAAKLAHPWNPASTTVILLSDGDSVPATRMPKMPASVANVLVIGVGDPVSGKFIDGQQSRQDASTLRQIAARLGGTYHNGNELHLSTNLIKQLTAAKGRSKLEQLSRREYALIACGVGGVTYALLPLLLHLFGTGWRPGVSVHKQPNRTGEPGGVSPRTESRRGLEKAVGP